jgi:hypothetical protein
LDFQEEELRKMNALEIIGFKFFSVVGTLAVVTPW